MTQITVRSPNSPKFLDLTGTVSPHGVRVIEYHGFAGKYSLWRCVCPFCQAEFLMRGNCMRKQLSCGCLKHRRNDDPNRKVLREYWYATIRHQCQPEWECFETFWKDIGSSLGQHQRVYRDRPEGLVGPSNFVVYDHRTIGCCGPNAQMIYAGGAQWSNRSISDLLKITRQRAHQLMQSERGVESLRGRIVLALKGQINPQPEAAG